MVSKITAFGPSFQNAGVGGGRGGFRFVSCRLAEIVGVARARGL